MARNSTATADTEAEAGDKSEVKAKDLPKDQRVSQMYGMPAGLKALLEEAAEAQNISAAAFTRDLVAKHFNYTLPASTRGGAQKKYANDEERENARKSKGQQRRALIRALLEKYQGGELNKEEIDAAAAIKAQEIAERAAEKANDADDDTDEAED